jgi:hypothetical protein
MPRNSGPYGTPAGDSGLFKPRQTRQHFTPEDDEEILRAVGDNKYPDWNAVALHVPGKTGRQCRERFQHYLSPTLTQAPWTPAEDDLVKRLFGEYGPDWARIAGHFAGARSNNNIKNRWNNHLRPIIFGGVPAPPMALTFALDRIRTQVEPETPPPDLSPVVEKQPLPSAPFWHRPPPQPPDTSTPCFAPWFDVTPGPDTAPDGWLEDWADCRFFGDPGLFPL